VQLQVSSGILVSIHHAPFFLEEWKRDKGLIGDPSVALDKLISPEGHHYGIAGKLLNQFYPCVAERDFHDAVRMRFARAFEETELSKDFVNVEFDLCKRESPLRYLRLCYQDIGGGLLTYAKRLRGVSRHPTKGFIATRAGELVRYEDAKSDDVIVLCHYSFES